MLNSQSILAKAVRGELVPQDPNEEPASELLKRIKAEREITQKGINQGKKNKKNKEGRNQIWTKSPMLIPSKHLIPSLLQLNRQLIKRSKKTKTDII